MEVKFPSAKKKSRVCEEVKSSFPVPISSLTGVEATPAAWHYYQATWEDGVITVDNHEQADALYNNVS